MQTMPIVDQVSMDLRDFMHVVEDEIADNVVDEAEKRRIRRVYADLQKRARRAAVFQRFGLSAARTGRIDKNLLTMLTALADDESEQEKAAIGWTPTTAKNLLKAA